MRRGSRHIILVLFGLLLVGCSTTSNVTEYTATSASVEIVTDVEATEEIVIDTPESRGRILFERTYDEVGFACASCHFPSEARLIGPGMAGIDSRLEGYSVEVSVEEYVRSSILNPQAFVPEETPAYPADVMPEIYGDLFTESELDDLITYILSL